MVFQWFFAILAGFFVFLWGKWKYKNDRRLFYFFVSAAGLLVSILAVLFIIASIWLVWTISV